MGAPKYHRSEDIRMRLQTLYAFCQGTLGAFDASQRVNDSERKKASGSPETEAFLSVLF